MDRRTRELERAWRETGDVACGLEFVRALARSGEDERELLAVRLALGELRPERARVAALLGHELLRELLPPKSIELGTKEIAELAQVSAATVRTWALERGCPHERRGRRYVFDLVEVVEWARLRPLMPDLPWVEVCAQLCQESLWPLLRALVGRYAAWLDARREPTLAGALRAWARAPSPESLAEVEEARARPADALELPGLGGAWAGGSLPRKTLSEPLHSREVEEWLDLFGLPPEERREAVAGPVIEWALSFDFEGALAGSAVARARLSSELPAGPDSLASTPAEDPARARIRARLEAVEAEPGAEEVLEWFAGLGELGAPFALRAALGLARAALGHWRRAEDAGEGDAVVLGLERCLRRPGRDSVERLRAAAEPMREALLAGRAAGRGPRDQACAHTLADAALLLRVDSSVEDLLRDAQETAALALGRVSYARDAALAPPEAVAAVRAELAPLLAGIDPLQD